MQGAGIVTHIWATLACQSESFLRKIVLRAYWDGEDAAEHRGADRRFLRHGPRPDRATIASLPMQASPEDGKAFNCYFPMPFGTDMKLHHHQRGRARPAVLLLCRPRAARRTGGRPGPLPRAVPAGPAEGHRRDRPDQRAGPVRRREHRRQGQLHHPRRRRATAIMSACSSASIRAAAPMSGTGTAKATT